MRSTALRILLGLGALIAGGLVQEAIACCAPCQGICGPESPADTVCCSGISSECDACGQTSCGACRTEVVLDHSCARGCDEAFLGCDGSDVYYYDETNCWAEFGICMDACLLEEMICENPPCPGTCLDDDHEEDDTLWQAHAMEPIHGREPVRLDGLVARAGDPDFFHAYADCCGHARVELQWNPADGFLRAHLLDGRGRPLDLSGRRDIVDRGTGFLRLAKAGYGGHFYVRVVGGPPDDGGPACVPYSAVIQAKVFVD